ncbi:acetyltransferase (GNAT) family protein [Roseibium hamelinense]|uniref:Acetyltransferase (GNAT) family protein n=1 Tax=Roseibium hamelinense TaxID=150831 RepID=A0A562TIM7_9HYPH|nr:GNAT family N-acetyltransferase [Roseibium hamelinense]MTI46043.1 GNAT family N-acetyltransferase [Roseibium hamelinense]TWI92766.1 acetyltransferase (GNAT) family protein [Roseibium hamelinense]
MLEPFEIKLARQQQASEIALLLRRSIIELCTRDHRGDAESYLPWVQNKTPENVKAWIAKEGAFLTAETSQGTVLGVAMASQAGEVLLNYVLPEARFRGVSRALMAELEGYLRASCGAGHVYLTSSRTAERFYRSLGYTVYGEAVIRKNMTFRRFRKRISHAQAV